MKENVNTNLLKGISQGMGRDSGCFSPGNHCRDGSLTRSGSAPWFLHMVAGFEPSLHEGLHALICKWVWLDLALGWALQKQL